LNLERFDTRNEEKVLVERWQHIYNRINSHSLRAVIRSGVRSH
jgi:hypothetical protein